jgi:hypothetical protein
VGQRLGTDPRPHKGPRSIRSRRCSLQRIGSRAAELCQRESELARLNHQGSGGCTVEQAGVGQRLRKPPQRCAYPVGEIHITELGQRAS